MLLERCRLVGGDAQEDTMPSWLIFAIGAVAGLVLITILKGSGGG